MPLLVSKSVISLCLSARMLSYLVETTLYELYFLTEDDGFELHFYFIQNEILLVD